jgi:peroxiredoxin
MTRLPKIFWIICGVLFAAASIAIQYQVKVVMHQRGAGSVDTLGNLKVGQPAPDFTLQDLAGHPVMLSADQGRAVVLMDFWATWCGPCRMEMIGLQKLSDKFKGGGFELLSVNQREAADTVRHFIESRKYSFHVILDAGGVVGDKYGVQAIPTLVLVDKKGVVRWLRAGYSENEDELRQMVEKLTKE